MNDEALRLGQSEAWHKSNELHTNTLHVVSEFLKMEYIHLISELVTSSDQVSHLISAAYVCGSDDDADDFLADALGKLARFEQNLLICCDLNLVTPAQKSLIYASYNHLILLIKATRSKKEYRKKPSLKLVK